MPEPGAGHCWTGSCTCPRCGLMNWERRREAGVPESVRFRTKPQLAQLMLGRALESGVPFAWFTGDEVYGSDRKLRLWLEREEIPHVMAIKKQREAVGFDGQGTATGEGGPAGVRGCGIRLGEVQRREWHQGATGL